MDWNKRLPNYRIEKIEYTSKKYTNHACFDAMSLVVPKIFAYKTSICL